MVGQRLPAFIGAVHRLAIDASVASRASAVEFKRREEAGAGQIEAAALVRSHQVAAEVVVGLGEAVYGAGRWSARSAGLDMQANSL